MAGRNRMPRRNHDGFRNFHEPVMNRGQGHLLIHPAALEEELEMQHREMQRIIAENRHVIDDNTILQQELTAAKDDIHRLGQFIPKLRAEKEADERELIERGLKLEADLRAYEPLRAEVIQLRSDIQKLNSLRQELSSQVQGLTKDINRMQAENQQLIVMRGNVEGMHKELVEARFDIDFLFNYFAGLVLLFRPFFYLSVGGTFLDKYKVICQLCCYMRCLLCV